MSRELKFRAWDELKKIMHHDFQYINSGESKDGSDWIVFKSDLQPLNENPHPFENPHFEQQLKIMQYTGLKDKNGKEIYEGDILNIQVPLGGFWGNTPNRKIAKVIYEPECGGYIAQWEYSKNQHHALLDCDLVFDAEVMGNLYEKPELIQQPNKP